MYRNMEDWTEIRRRVLVEGVSRRQILRETGMHWLTLKKILEHSEGMVLGVATFLATKNPAGLIINAGVQAYGEASGSDEVTGRAKATAKGIPDVLKKRFQATRLDQLMVKFVFEPRRPQIPKCQQKCQQTSLVGSKMELRKVGWSYP
jgi:hypothetical protein